MNNIFGITHELAEALKQSEEYRSMKQLEDQALKNDEAILLFQEHTELQAKMRSMLQSDDQNSETVQEIRLRILQVEHRLKSLDAISAMLSARERFNLLINQVNEILRFELTGKLPDQNADEICTGSCANCPGCHA